MVRPSLSDGADGNIVSQTLHGVVRDYGGLISSCVYCLVEMLFE